MNTSMQRALALVLIINFLHMAQIQLAAEDILFALRTLKQVSCLKIRSRIQQEDRFGLMIMKRFSIR